MTNLLFAPPALGAVLSLTGLPGGSNKIHDRSPYGNHGTITGATWKRLPSGLWYLYFDGNDDYIDCGQGTNLSFGATDSFTIMFWVNGMSGVGIHTVMGKGNPIGNPAWSGFVIQIRAGQIKAAVGDGTNRAALNYVGLLQNDGLPHFTAFRLDRSIEEIECFVDGTTTGNTVSTVAVGSLVSIDPLRIGIASNALNSDFLGGMARPRLYRRALTALEIQNYFNREKHLFGVW